MGNCKDCKNWDPAEEYLKPECVGELGACKAIGDVELWGVVPAEALAVTRDAENYASKLFTRPAFGCVLHEPAPASEPAHQSQK